MGDPQMLFSDFFNVLICCADFFSVKTNLPFITWHGSQKAEGGWILDNYDDVTNKRYH